MLKLTCKVLNNARFLLIFFRNVDKKRFHLHRQGNNFCMLHCLCRHRGFLSFFCFVFNKLTITSFIKCKFTPKFPCFVSGHETKSEIVMLGCPISWSNKCVHYFAAGLVCPCVMHSSQSGQNVVFMRSQYSTRFLQFSTRKTKKECNLRQWVFIAKHAVRNR